MSGKPTIGEEIMVNAAHGVFTLPLQPSGLSSGPRFVVHVPAPEQQPAADKFVATFRCESNGIVGHKNAPIHSVSMHDDGVIEVAIDHWPEQPAAARGEVKVGDRVRAIRDGSAYYRKGDCGTVLSIDRDGDFWVRWENPIVPDLGHGWCISPHNCALAAPPPAAARGDMRGLVALAERVQYADTHALVSKDDAGEFICLPPWLWLEIRDAAAEALAAEGVQAGEVSAYDLAVLDDAAETLDRLGDGSAGLRAARARIASALSQQPEARGVVDEVIGKLPADLTHSQAWPQDYVNGWNEALRLVREELPAALAEARNVR